MLYVAAALLGLVLGVYVLVAVLAYAFADRVIFQPPAASYTREDVAFQRLAVGQHDSIAFVYLPGDSAALTVLYSHGNAEDLLEVAPALQQLHALGFGVIGYDYRGYGRSQGGPATVAKATADAEVVYAYATARLGIKPERLVTYGRSVGSGPTLEVAANHRIGGVVLESAFTSAFRVLTRASIFPFDHYRNLELVRRLRCPVLVIHGTADRIVPFAHGRNLYAAAPNAKLALWVEGAGHNDVVAVAGSRYPEALTRFADVIRATNAREASSASKAVR